MSPSNLSVVFGPTLLRMRLDTSYLFCFSFKVELVLDAASVVSILFRSMSSGKYIVAGMHLVFGQHSFREVCPARLDFSQLYLFIFVAVFTGCNFSFKLKAFLFLSAYGWCLLLPGFNPLTKRDLYSMHQEFLKSALIIEVNGQIGKSNV